MRQVHVFNRGDAFNVAWAARAFVAREFPEFHVSGTCENRNGSRVTFDVTRDRWGFNPAARFTATCATEGAVTVTVTQVTEAGAEVVHNFVQNFNRVQ